MERIRAASIRSAIPGAAALKPGGLDEFPVGVREVCAAPEWIGKRRDRRSKTALQVLPRAVYLFFSLLTSGDPKVHMRPRVSTDLEAFPVQCANLVPGHPGVRQSPLLVPPGDPVGFHPLRDDEKGGGQRKPFED